MSDAARQINGSFIQETILGGSFNGQASNVFIEGQNQSNNPRRTAGVVRVAQVTITPNVLQAFSIVGWSLRLYLVFSANLAPFYATMGKLWGGLLIDSPLQNAGGWSINPTPLHQVPGQAVLPPDLSTFTTLWTQDEDVTVTNYDITSLPLPPPNLTNLGGVVPQLIGTTFMFPAGPVEVRPSAQLQMALVMTPSVMTKQLWMVAVQADFTILYTTQQMDFSGVHGS